MKENVIKQKSFDFALQTIQAYKIIIDEKKEFVLSKQFLRSGTAIGALVYEAEHADPRARPELSEAKANQISSQISNCTKRSE